MIQAGNRREEVVLEKMEQYSRHAALPRAFGDQNSAHKEAKEWNRSQGLSNTLSYDHERAMKEAAKFGGMDSRILQAINGSTTTRKSYSHTSMRDQKLKDKFLEK